MSHTQPPPADSSLKNLLFPHLCSGVGCAAMLHGSLIYWGDAYRALSVTSIAMILSNISLTIGLFHCHLTVNHYGCLSFSTCS